LKAVHGLIDLISEAAHLTFGVFSKHFLSRSEHNSVKLETLSEDYHILVHFIVQDGFGSVEVLRTNIGNFLVCIAYFRN